MYWGKGGNNNAKQAAEAEEDEEPEAIDEDILRDQGFTRAKALILVPNKLAGLRVVRLMLDLLPENAYVGKKQKFWDEFLEAEEDEETIALKISR